MPSRKKRDTITFALERVQNKCLRAISGGFRATPIRILEVLTFVPPIDIVLTTRTAAYHLGARENGMDDVIGSLCEDIFLGLTSNPNQPPPLDRQHAYAERIPETWSQEWQQIPRKENTHPPKQSNVITRRWQDHWRSQPPLRSLPILLRDPDSRILRLHRSLSKAQSSLHTQIVTEKIGLNAFLYKAKVPEVPLPPCRWCGRHPETAKHITCTCSAFREQRKEISTNGHLDYRSLFVNICNHSL